MPLQRGLILVTQVGELSGTAVRSRKFCDQSPDAFRYQDGHVEDVVLRVVNAFGAGARRRKWLGLRVT